MEESARTCNTLSCELHFHAYDSISVNEERPQVAQLPQEEQQTGRSGSNNLESSISPKGRNGEEQQKEGIGHDAVSKERGSRRIIRNFTPS